MLKWFLSSKQNGTNKHTHTHTILFILCRKDKNVLKLKFKKKNYYIYTNTRTTEQIKKKLSEMFDDTRLYTTNICFYEYKSYDADGFLATFFLPPSVCFLCTHTKTLTV